jgi:menaquinone-specific isochorismate synthase
MSLTPEIANEIGGAKACRELITRLTEYKARSAKQTGLGFVRFATRIQSIDLLNWLDSQEVIAKYYWRSRDNATEFAALSLPRFGLTTPTVTAGMLFQTDDQIDQPLPESIVLRWFNSFPFAGVERFDDEMRAVPAPFNFLVPDIEIVSGSDGTWLISTLQHLADAKLLQEGLEALVWDEPSELTFPILLSREEAQSRLQWAVAINRAVAAIARKEIEKVVLARRSTCKFSDAVSPWQLLKRLRESNPDCYLFGVDRKPYDPFVGASPERLYRRIGREIETEAVAGTRPRGNNAEEENRYRDDLLHSSKDRNEHELVVRGITESLRPLTSKIEILTEPTIVRLATVQHLVVKIRATLRPGIVDDDLLRQLQPTPAVGGYPRNKAVEMIRLLEPFDRGPYAGPIGWVSHTAAEFAVGIRSAVIKHDNLVLYAGAGIVEGSDPDAEWDEIDQKFKTFASILTAQ